MILPGPDWIRIGILCSAERRSLWFREHADRIELCAGREGGDNYVAIDRSNPQFAGLRAVLTDARFAAECSTDWDKRPYACLRCGTHAQLHPSSKCEQCEPL